MESKKFNRKEFLQLSLAMGTLGVLPACALFDKKEMLVCSLEDLTASGALIRRFNRRRIFFTLRQGKILAISLRCTHKRCTVGWEAATEQFICPCHDGRYDRDGKVLDGPPEEALRRYKTDLREDQVYILNEWV